MSLKDDSMEDFIQTATRGPKRGITEQLLCHKLLSANQTGQIKRVIFITEAAWSLDPDKAKEQGIDPDTVEVLHKVATTLNSTIMIKAVIPGDHPYESGTLYCIYPLNWGFEHSEENYNKYLKPWFPNAGNYYPALIRYWYGKSIKDFESVGERNFIVCKVLTDSGFVTIRNAFIYWAQPIATRIEAQIAATIDPRTYQQYFQAQQREGEGGQGEDSVDKGK